MKFPELEITIDKTGKMSLHIHGVPGAECLQYAELIKEIVGQEDSRKTTSEYYQSEGVVRIHSGVQGPLLHQHSRSKPR